MHQSMIRRAFMILGVASLAVVARPARATQGVLYVSGTATLTEDHFGTIVFNASNTTLDCQGHGIFNDTQGAICPNSTTCGVFVGPVTSKPTIKNCTIQNFNNGIYVYAAQYPNILSNTVSNNGRGIYLYQSQGNSPTRSISNNYLGFNTTEGLRIQGIGGGHRVIGNTFEYNGRDGVDVGDSGGNTFSNNFFGYNHCNGLELDGSSGNKILSNSFYFNGDQCVDSVTGAVETKNGISLDSSPTFTIQDNYVYGSSRDGIRISASNQGGTVNANTAFFSGEHDAHQNPKQPKSGGNVWTNNNFNTHCGLPGDSACP